MTKRTEDLESFASHLATVMPVPEAGQDPSTVPQEWYIRVYHGLSLALRKPRPDHRLRGRFGITKTIEILDWCKSVTEVIGQSRGTIWFEALTTGDSPDMIVWTRIYSEGDPADEAATRSARNDFATTEFGAVGMLAHELVSRSKEDAETIRSQGEHIVRVMSAVADVAFLHGQWDERDKIGSASNTLAAKERAFNRLVDLPWPAIIASWKTNGPVDVKTGAGAETQPEGGNARVKWDLTVMSQVGQDLVALRMKDKANFTDEDIAAFEKLASGAAQMAAAIKAGLA